MTACNICLENTQINYHPQYRYLATGCVCNYVVHEHCYKTWLAQSNMAYNCIICHKTVRLSDVNNMLSRIKKVSTYFITLFCGFLLLYFLNIEKRVVTILCVGAYMFTYLIHQRVYLAPIHIKYIVVAVSVLFMWALTEIIICMPTTIVAIVTIGFIDSFIRFRFGVRIFVYNPLAIVN